MNEERKDIVLEEEIKDTDAMIRKARQTPIQKKHKKLSGNTPESRLEQLIKPWPATRLNCSSHKKNSFPQAGSSSVTLNVLLPI